MLSVVWIVFGFIILYLILCFSLFLLAFHRFPPKHDPLRNLNQGAEKSLVDYPELVNAGHKWLAAAQPEDVELLSHDGLRLHGTLYRTPEAKAVLVACHGYRSTGRHDFNSALPFYSELGFHILLIDQRSCGLSEGKYTAMGILERFDICDWCAFAGRLFPHLPVVAAGISMGASSVLMAADTLPDCVKAIIADCPYISAWDELTYVVHHFVHIPAAPILFGIDLWCRLLAGFSLRQFTVLDALKANRHPIFLVHGAADQLVPYANSRKIHEFCNNSIVLLSSPHAGHGMSFLVSNQAYREALETFITPIIYR